MNLLELKNITKYYIGPAGSKLLVLDKINLIIKEDEKVVSVVAPFGSGKSTLLKIISGIERYSEGESKTSHEIKLPGEIAFIPENPSSFPWLSVKQNIETGIRLSNGKSDNVRSVEELIHIVGLKGYEDHFPNEKSIGFRFRISLARALAVAPKLLTIDDSFRKAARETRDELIGLIKKISRELNKNFLFATTNIPDAISVADKILLMSKNPARIFEEIDIQTDTAKVSSNQEKITEIKSRIESAFRKENMVNTIDISI